MNRWSDSLNDFWRTGSMRLSYCGLSSGALSTCCSEISECLPEALGRLHGSETAMRIIAGWIISSHAKSPDETCILDLRHPSVSSALRKMASNVRGVWVMILAGHLLHGIWMQYVSLSKFHFETKMYLGDRVARAKVERSRLSVRIRQERRRFTRELVAEDLPQQSVLS